MSRALFTLAGIMQERQRATQFSFHQMISSFHSHSYGLDAHAHIIATFVSMTARPYAVDVIQS